MRISANPAIQRALEKGLGGTATQSSGSKGDFGQMLMDVIQEVNDSQTKAANVQADYMTGRRPVEVHEVMIAAEKASTTMQLTLAVRNKLLEAYQELSRMQI